MPSLYLPNPRQVVWRCLLTTAPFMADSSWERGGPGCVISRALHPSRLSAPQACARLLNYGWIGVSIGLVLFQPLMLSVHAFCVGVEGGRSAGEGVSECVRTIAVLEHCFRSLENMFAAASGRPLYSLSSTSQQLVICFSPNTTRGGSYHLVSDLKGLAGDWLQTVPPVAVASAIERSPRPIHRPERHCPEEGGKGSQG